MSTVLAVLVLTALLVLVLRQLERNHRRSLSGLAAAPGSVALDRDAERVGRDVQAAAPARPAGPRTPSQPARRPAGRGVTRLA